MDNYNLEPYRIVYKFSVELLSPLIIGSGESYNSDSDVIKDKDGKTFIPATSFAGVLRHFLKNHYNIDIENIFGHSNGANNFSSKIIFTDLVPDNKPTVIIRDGIKIDNSTGITEDQKKFDFEIIESGAVFKGAIEIKDSTPTTIKQLIKTIDNELKKGNISIGGKTNLGFGKIKIIRSYFNYYDLTQKEDITKWILKKDNETDLNQIVPYEDKNNNLTIDFDFFIKDSLIVRYYIFEANDNEEENNKIPDSIHIKSNNKFVIPGTSIKGSIRARAERILNTLEIEKGKGKDFLTYFLGNSLDENHDSGENKGSIPSRLSINEVIVKQEIEAGIQERIKIDRFTGGTIKGALFDSMPIFAKEYNTTNKMRIIIKNPFDAEIGLMLLILKDLWTGDLPIGGEKSVGRGMLIGSKFSLKYKDFEINDSDIFKLEEKDLIKCKKYVNTLNNGDFSAQLNEYYKIYPEAKNE